MFHQIRSPNSGLCSLPDLPHEMVHPTADMLQGVVIIFSIIVIIIICDGDLLKGATNMPWDELLQLALGSLEELEEYNALSSLSHKVNHVGNYHVR